MPKVPLHMNGDMYQEVEERAIKERRTRANYIRKILAEHFENDK